MKNRLGWMGWASLGFMAGYVQALDLTFTAVQTVFTNIVLSEDTTVTVNDSTSSTPIVSFTGVVSGPGKLTKAGPDRVQLSNVNTYSGGTDIQAGRLYVKGNGALGTGPVKLLTSTAQLATPSDGGATVTNDIEVYASGTVTLPVLGPPLTLSGRLRTMSAPLKYSKAGGGTVIFKGPVDAEDAASARFELTVGDIRFEAGANVVLTNNAAQPTVSFSVVEATAPATYKRSMVVDVGASVTMSGVDLGGKYINTHTPLNTLEVKGGSLTLTGYIIGSTTNALSIVNGLTNVIRVSGGTVFAADNTIWSMNNSGSSNTLMQVSGGTVSLSQFSMGNQIFGAGYDPSKIDVVVSGGVLEARHKWLWLNHLNHRVFNTLTVNGGTVRLPITSSGFNEYLVVPCQTRMTLNGGTFEALGSSEGDYLMNVKQLYLGSGSARIDTGANTVKIDAARFTSLNGGESAGIVKLGTGRLWLTRLPVTGGVLDVQEGTVTLQDDTGSVARLVPNDPMYLYSFETDIVTDSTRNTWHATLTGNDGNVTLDAGAGLDGRQSISLDGTKGLSVAHTNYSEEISEWTLSAWVRQAAAAGSEDGNTFLSSCDDNAAQAETFYARINADRTFSLCHSGPSGSTAEDDVILTTTATAPLDIWTLLTVKADGLEGVSLYVNGVKQTVTAVSGGSTLTTNVYGTGKRWYLVAPGRATADASPALHIGKKLDSGTTCFSGDMDDVTLYKRALSDSEIAVLSKRANPYASRVCVAADAVLDLSNSSLTLGTVKGEGHVNNGTLKVTATLAPGATNSLPGAVLSVEEGLTLGTNLVYACGWSALTNDVVAVGGTLTVDGAGTIDLGLDAESTEFAKSGRRSFPVFTYGSLSGAENFSNWTVTGFGKGPVSSASVTAADGSVRVRVTFRDGTLIRVL